MQAHAWFDPGRWVYFHEDIEYINWLILRKTSFGWILYVGNKKSKKRFI